MAITIILSVIVGILVGIVGMTAVLMIYANHYEKKEKERFQNSLNSFVEGLKKGLEDDKK